MTLKTLHRYTAILLGLFIISHLIVHLFALAGPEAHLAALDAVQWTYRNPVGELILVFAILVQIYTGFKRLKSKKRIGWAKAQVYSGMYLIMFLIVHTSAALYTHHIFGLETDFYWAAGSLHFNPLRFGFALYYFLAILAFFVHMAAAIRFGWPKTSRAILRTIPISGAIIACLILSAFWGAYYVIDIPPEVTEYYSKYFGIFGIRE